MRPKAPELINISYPWHSFHSNSIIKTSTQKLYKSTAAVAEKPVCKLDAERKIQAAHLCQYVPLSEQSLYKNKTTYVHTPHLKVKSGLTLSM